MPALISALILLALFFIMFTTVHYIDRDVKMTQSFLNTGNELCKDHNGLKFFDYANNFTCNNNIEIIGNPSNDH
jgi:hypothetical protein